MRLGQTLLLPLVLAARLAAATRAPVAEQSISFLPERVSRAFADLSQPQTEEETLGLEGQDEAERSKCMRDKQERPSGLLESHLGAKFASKLRVDSLTNTQKLQGAVCQTEGGCGLFNLTHPQPAEGKACVREVPQLIHFVWLDHPMPEKYARNVAEVMRVNPGRQVLLWINKEAKDVSALTKIITGRDFSGDPQATESRLHVKDIEAYKDRFRNWDIIQKEPNVGARSDWIRLEAVYLYGGIYMDTDVKAFHDFNDYGGVFRWPFVAYSDPKSYGNLCNCVFSAEKRSPLVKLAIEGWREANLNEPHIPSGPPFGCGVWTSAFMTYNQPEILMLYEKYIFKGTEADNPVMTMTFDGSWMTKDM